jgi:hypothetical protein
MRISLVFWHSIGAEDFAASGAGLALLIGRKWTYNFDYKDR